MVIDSASDAQNEASKKKSSDNDASTLKTIFSSCLLILIIIQRDLSDEFKNLLKD